MGCRKRQAGVSSGPAFQVELGRMEGRGTAEGSPQAGKRTADMLGLECGRQVK